MDEGVGVDSVGGCRPDRTVVVGPKNGPLITDITHIRRRRRKGLCQTTCGQHSRVQSGGQQNSRLDMEIRHPALLFYLFAMACFLACAESLNRTDFPAGFMFGSASSSYQYEGAAKEDGRGSSIWDTFTRTHPEKIADHSSGDIADEFYYRFLEDIALMKEVGFESFRFSISWSRILPKGKLSGGVNQEGVAFYNDLINELLYQGEIFNSPQANSLLLCNAYWDDYRDYADFCFKEFGDRVKFWTTFNEPHTFAEKGYATGTNAPGRCSNYSGNCTFGNSGTEPYIVGHHILLSHAAAVRLYREKYQLLSSFPFTCRYANPLTFGDYPETMRALVGDRLPKFTASQSEMVKGSLDFLGVNYYTARYADNITSSTGDYPSYTTDSHVNLTTEKDGVLIGEPTASSWLYIYPRGIRELVLYINRTYNPPPIYITENGLNDKGSLPLQDALDDIVRLKYHRSHMSYVLEAIKAGVDVRGYLAWSFLDNFEWESGKICILKSQTTGKENDVADKEKISDHSTGDVAVDFYYRFKEDINLVKELGLDSFRFSISWSRILPSKISLHSSFCHFIWEAKRERFGRYVYQNQKLGEGFKAFNEIPVGDVCSWTQMAAGCLQCGEPSKALEIVAQMKKMGIKPNKFTLATALNACANIASLAEGKKVHGLRIKLGRDIDVCVDNALLDMYAKCGCVDSAWAVFRSMNDHSIVSWTTMIMACAINGQSRKALKIYDEMRLKDIHPNCITFICVLYACGQGGFLDEGRKLFSSMACDYGILPQEDHYACMVNLLGRAGRLKEAEELILGMPFKPGVLVWKTLLGACHVYGDMEIGKHAAEHVLHLDRNDPSTYVVLSNLFAGLSNWDSVGMLRELMETQDVKKIPGSSWIEVEKNRSLIPKLEGCM
ncbi:Beta-glucosidase 17 [Morella rubra]|uniref:Beta-glucosidase 17 n=1 Tax=Morella rubra TaxID=262757 RepID=A0A6A1WQ32_9ROSI|nr:Beta-glucosidase 17 [Morella rubra]